MQWNLIGGPIIGAIIGYITNKIAVEMLFRPLKPIYIGKFKLPFTPGIIPNGKERLAKAIGEAVGNNLLTTDTIKETLLSKEMEASISQHLDSLLENMYLEQTTIETKLKQNIGETTTSYLQNNLKQSITTKASQGLISMDLGEIVAKEVMSAVQAKVKGTMLSMMLNASTLSPIISEIKKRVNLYVEEHGEEKVSEFVDVEFGNIMEQPVSRYITDQNADQFKEVILNLYRNLVSNYGSQLLTSLNLSHMVEEKVCDMDVLEVEELLLLIMKKELGAVVKLGAVIGFILGLVNIFL